MGERGRKSQIDVELSPERREEVRAALLQVILHPGGKPASRRASPRANEATLRAGLSCADERPASLPARYGSCEDVYWWLGLADDGISLSALRRWYRRLRIEARVVETKKLAAALGEAVDLTKAVESLTLDELFNRLIADESLRPATVCSIGQTVAQLKRAAVAERKDRRQETEWQETRERARRAAEKVAGRLGKRIDAETLKRIREDIYGIVDS